MIAISTPQSCASSWDFLYKPFFRLLRVTLRAVLSSRNAVPIAALPMVSIHSPYSALIPVSYTHLRAHETPEHLVCRLLLEKKKKKKTKTETLYKKDENKEKDIKLVENDYT
eukprot:TRINITY_DN1550_c0_g1_i16.p3 TRINITY_DN1550_c0_g1~~TRINITY_DN1550_c0_g1_i16.p3  ORF type:complete len:112 (+),score=14.09 TRINITY_DN1550_c0_g1_i16:826-1161(+)